MERIYHYTSMEVFYNLIKSVEEVKNKTCFVFWASNVLYMNDPKEFSFGLKIIMYALKEIESNKNVDKKYRISDLWKEESIREASIRDALLKVINEDNESPYAISFSREEDSLPMWLNYANRGRGVCLAFAEYRNRVEERISDEDTNGSGIVIYDTMNAHDVYYCSSALKVSQNNRIYKRIEEMYDEYYRSKIPSIDLNSLPTLQLGVLKAFTFLVAPYIKTSGFEGEKEVRMVKSIKFDFDNNNKEVQFKLSNRGNLIPYVRVGIPVSQLDYVRIGPLANYNLSLYSLEMMKKKYDMDFDIKPSNLEYQDY